MFLKATAYVVVLQYQYISISSYQYLKSPLDIFLGEAKFKLVSYNLVTFEGVAKSKTLV